MKDGGPAFPCSVRKKEKYMDEGGYGRERVVTVQEGGMSLRDYFAAKAMASIIAVTQGVVKVTPKLAAEDAYLYADAMLAAREVPK